MGSEREREREEKKEKKKKSKRGSKSDKSSKSGSGRKAVLAKSTDTGEAASELADLSWYHGLLTRDDCASLLIHKGDFVVRTSQLENETKTVVSVYWDGDVKHFLIIKTASGQYYLHESKHFHSIEELIDYHQKERLPLSKTSDALLVNPVAKADWELEHEQLKTEEKLGKGAFGEVFKGKLVFKGGTKEVAIKSCSGKGSKEDRMAFMKEARIMRQYQHPNVIRIFGVAAQKEPLYIVMELAPGGSLLTYLKKTWPGLAQKEQLRVVLDVAKGMEYLEQRQCIHRDLAARNCLLGKDKEVKICDFGLSSVAKAEQVTGGLRLPIKWTAPEALHECKFSSKSDVWSFGILVTEVWSGGAEPYPGKTTTDIKKGVLEGLRTAVPESMPGALRDLLTRTWELDPRNRPSFTAIRDYLAKL